MGSLKNNNQEKRGPAGDAGAARIAAVFAIVGVVWIGGTDWLLANIARPEIAAVLAPAKGFAFVLVTAALIYFVAARNRFSEAFQYTEDLHGTGRLGLTARMNIVIFMALAPVMAMVGYSFHDQRARAMADAEASLVNHGDAANTQVQNVLRAAKQVLLVISRTEAALNPASPKCGALLREINPNLPQFHNLGVILADGTLGCSALEIPGHVDLSDRHYFRDAWDFRAMSVGVYQHSRIAAFTSVNIGYPVIGADGSLMAVVFGALDLRALDEALSLVELPTDSMVMLLDRHRTVVAGHPGLEEWIGKPVPGELLPDRPEWRQLPKSWTDSHGVRRMYAFRPVDVPRSDMVVGVGISLDTVLAPTAAQLANTAARTLVAVTVALIGAWALGWFWVVQPAEALVGAARRLARGDFTARSGVAGVAGELGSIGQAFDDMAASLERSETRYRATFEQAALGIAHLSLQGRFVRFNHRLCEILGYPPEELRELNLARVMHPDDREIGERLVRRISLGKHAGRALEARCLRRDGATVWTRQTLSFVESAGAEPDYFIAVVDDIGDRKWAENRVERLAALYRTLSETNEAIVRTAEAQRLFREICEIIASFGGFALAWVGRVNAERKLIQVVAKAGAKAGYLAGLEITLDPDLPASRGPSGRAVLSGEPVICNDFLANPLTAPWHGRAREFGIGASAAFPLRQDGAVIGVLNVYASDAGFFDSEIVSLLSKMVLNISFGLDAMARDARRRDAEAALRRNDERLDAMLRLSEAAADLPESEIAQRALKEGIRLTDSSAGCVCLASKDGNMLQVVAISGVEIEGGGPPMRVPLAEAGPWADCVRLRAPYISNEPDGRGGGVLLGIGALRHAAIPALDRGHVASILVVAGRSSEYVGDDLRQLQLVGETLWRLMEGKRAQREALDAEAKFRGTFEHSAVGMVNVGIDGRFLRVNSRFCEMAGYPADKLLGMTFQAITHPEDLPNDLGLAQRLMTGEIPSYTIEKRYVRQDGTVLWGLLTVSALRLPDGMVEYFIAVVEDITLLKAAQERMRLDAMVFEGSREGIVITNADARIIRANRAFSEITGYTREEVVGQKPSMLSSGRHGPEFYGQMWDSLAQSGRWSGEIWNRRKSGDIYPEWLAISALSGPDDKVSHYIGIFSDISGEKQAQDTIQRLLQYDHLTQLPNRALMRERLELTLGHVRHRERKAAVLMLNLRRFRAINESFGQQAGDAVLRTVAQRLAGALRSGDTVSRLDADNFAIILNDMERSDDAATLAGKLLEVVSRPLFVNGQELVLTACIGISAYPDDGEDGDALLRSAQAALASAREEGRAGYRFSDPALNEAAQERLVLAGELHNALARGELTLHYQPLIDLVSGDVNGVEALLRWNHPRLGMVLPGRFIHIAEDTGLISAIGEWALEQICRQGREWRERFDPNLRLAVNVSSLQIRDGSLLGAVRRSLEKTGLPASALEIEVTESYFLSHADANRNTLLALKEMGVTFAIDDFGTHFAGLGFIRYFPVDRVKVDQSFIREIATHAGDAAISRAIISMAHGLGMKVSAEGVETEAQLQYLRRLHCDEAQGFLFSPALPVGDIEQRFNAPRRVRGEETAARTLLLVDDEANVLASLNRALRREGYRILSATSAREALEILATQQIGVILSDQRMPGMTGTEFLSRVKIMYPQVVRIVLSGHTDVSTITDAVNRGAVYKFLTKPWEDTVLRDTLREAFERFEDASTYGGE